MKLRERKRMGLVMRQIYALFEPNPIESNLGFKKRKILAADALKKVEGSHVTILRAREYLGVEARVIAGRHCWMPPKTDLQEALDKARRGSKSNIYNLREEKKARYERYASDLAQSLPDIMMHNGYDASPETIKNDIILLTGRKHNNGVINMACHKAGIISRKLSDGWHWLLPPPGIRDWLETRLKNGPVSQLTLVNDMEKSGWNINILNLFRTGYGFSQFKKDRLWYWYDVNEWSPDRPGKDN